MDCQLVQLDFSVNLSQTAMGIVPLKKSLCELAAVKTRVHMTDANEWLTRFWFARNGGLPIVRVDEKRAAYIAGVRACDVIVCVNAKDVRDKTAAKITAMIRKAEGTRVNLSILRCLSLPYNPETVFIAAEQTKRGRTNSYAVQVRISKDLQRPERSFGFTPLRFSFADCENLPRAQKFVEKEMKQRCPFAIGVGGLPVQSVDADGPAANAGLESWDVITFVNGRDITGLHAAEVIAIIRDTPGDVDLEVQRSVDPIVIQQDTPSAFAKAISSLHRLAWKSKEKRDSSEELHRSFEEFGGARANMGEDGVVTAAVGVQKIHWGANTNVPEAYTSPPAVYVPEMDVFTVGRVAAN